MMAEGNIRVHTNHTAGRAVSQGCTHGRHYPIITVIESLKGHRLSYFRQIGNQIFVGPCQGEVWGHTLEQRVAASTL